MLVDCKGSYCSNVKELKTVLSHHNIVIVCSIAMLSDDGGCRRCDGHTAGSLGGDGGTDERSPCGAVPQDYREGQTRPPQREIRHRLACPDTAAGGGEGWLDRVSLLTFRP